MSIFLNLIKIKRYFFNSILKKSIHKNFDRIQLYWLPINNFFHDVDVRQEEILLINEENSEIVKFEAGVGFLAVASKLNKNIYISECLFNQTDSNKNCTFNRLTKLSFSQFSLISCGRNHSLIYGLIDDFTHPSLVSFGNNTFGQCSNENNAMNICDNIIAFPHLISQIQCGLDHSLVLTDKGRVYSCGLGTDGQTGLQTYENVYMFNEISFPESSFVIKKISCCADTNLALTSDNRVYGWGNNEYGQLFENINEIQINRPTELFFGNTVEIQDVLALGSFCLVVTNTNKIMAWGFGKFNGHATTYRYPTEIQLFGSDGKIVNEKIIKIRGSVHYAVLMTISGRMFVVGNYPTENRNLNTGRSLSNEIIFPRPLTDFCSGSNGIFYTM